MITPACSYKTKDICHRFDNRSIARYVAADMLVRELQKVFKLRVKYQVYKPSSKKGNHVFFKLQNM